MFRNGCDRFLHLERFRQMCIHSGGQTFLRIFFIRIGRHGNDGNSPGIGPGDRPDGSPIFAFECIFIYITILTAGRQPYCSSIFSIKIPYPLVLSCTRTWVTAPTNLPFWMIGAPLIPWTIPPVRVIRSESVTFSSIPRFTLS